MPIDRTVGKPFFSVVITTFLVINDRDNKTASSTACLKLSYLIGYLMDMYQSYNA